MTKDNTNLSTCNLVMGATGFKNLIFKKTIMNMGVLWVEYEVEAIPIKKKKKNCHVLII